jgi:putative tryptophan/tyrosine transport system substrate-binding protein
MRRREFIKTVSIATAAAFPLLTHAQSAKGMSRVGLLAPWSAGDTEGQVRVTAFAQALQQLGWTDGKNVRIEYRWTEGNADTARKYSAELAALKPDVILTLSSAATAPMLEATRTVPIVFAGVADPVLAGYVDSLARPGGNITGFTVYEYSIAGKWLELLKELAPEVKRAAVLRETGVALGAGLLGTLQALAQSQGIELRPISVRDPDEIERALATFAQTPNGGLIATGGAVQAAQRELLVALAAKHRLPAIYNARFFVAAGGLLSYGSDFVDQSRRAAGYVDRILKGERPADLPVQAPTRYSLVINLKTAKALNLTMPPGLLARADEVIE